MAMHLHHPTKLLSQQFKLEKNGVKMVKVWQKHTKTTDALVFLQPLHVFIKLIEVKGPETSCGDFDQAGSWMPCILGQYFPGMFASAGPSRSKQDKKEGSASNRLSKLFTNFQCLTATSSLSREHRWSQAAYQQAKICKDFQQNINPDTAYTNHLKRRSAFTTSSVAVHLWQAGVSQHDKRDNASVATGEDTDVAASSWQAYWG